MAHRINPTPMTAVTLTATPVTVEALAAALISLPMPPAASPASLASPAPTLPPVAPFAPSNALSPASAKTSAQFQSKNQRRKAQKKEAANSPKSPQEPQAWKTLGKDLASQGKHADALGAYLNALKSIGNQPSALNAEGELFLEINISILELPLENQPAKSEALNRIDSFCKLLFEKSKIEPSSLPLFLCLAQATSRVLKVIGDETWLQRSRAFLSKAVLCSPSSEMGRRIHSALGQSYLLTFKCNSTANIPKLLALDRSPISKDTDNLLRKSLMEMLVLAQKAFAQADAEDSEESILVDFLMFFVSGRDPAYRKLMEKTEIAVQCALTPRARLMAGQSLYKYMYGGSELQIPETKVLADDVMKMLEPAANIHPDTPPTLAPFCCLFSSALHIAYYTHNADDSVLADRCYAAAQRLAAGNPVFKALTALYLVLKGKTAEAQKECEAIVSVCAHDPLYMPLRTAARLYEITFKGTLALHLAQLIGSNGKVNKPLWWPVYVASSMLVSYNAVLENIRSIEPGPFERLLSELNSESAQAKADENK
jgi:hypothetical protein